MPGVSYNCTHCTFNSYTLGVLKAHGKLFHKGLKIKKAGKLLTQKTYTSSKRCTKRAKWDQLTKRTCKSNLDCPHCRYRSTTSWNLKQHIISSHTDTRLFKCQRCKKSFSSKYQLQHHMISHSFTRMIKCPLCTYSASRPGRLRLHVREVHTGFKTFQCNLCKARFKRVAHLQSHKSSVHSSETFTCPICCKRLSSRDSLERHIKIHKEKAAPVKCEICHKIYGTIQRLRLHTKRMHGHGNRKTLDCKICGLLFEGNANLSAHLRRVHSKKTSAVACPFCPKVTNHNNETPEKSYRCSQCSASFITQGHLTRHQRGHGMKTFKCSLCSAMFRNRSALRIHLFTHNKTARYSCSVCAKKCRNTSELKMHFKTHTKQEEKMKCKHGSCDKLFTDKRNMLHHWRKEHLRLYRQKCSICGRICNNSRSLQVSLKTA